MNYYFIISIPILLVLSRIFLTNFALPFFKRKALYKQARTRSDWKMIEKKITLLQTLFKHVHAKVISIRSRLLHLKQNKEFIYGEVDFLPFYTMLEKAKLKENEIFYDLGSGAGKAVFIAGLFFKLSKCCGIELLTPLYKEANKQLDRAKQLLENSIHEAERKYWQQLITVEFINSNFLDYDFSDANLVYIAATCLNDSTWEKLINKMNNLKPGSRVIVATKSIQHTNFKLIYKGIELMSWGLCPVKIYEICSSRIENRA